MALTYEEWKARRAARMQPSTTPTPDPTSIAAAIGPDKVAPYGVAGMVAQGTGATAAPAKKAEGGLGNPGDMLAGALSGVLNAGAETADAVGTILNDHRLASKEFEKKGGFNFIPSAPDMLSQALVDWGVMDAKDGDLFKGAKPWVAPRDNAAGNISQGIAQFLTAFVGVGKVMKLKTGASAVLGTVGQGLAKGAVADFIAFDGNEARLSNLLRQNAGLRDPVTAYLAADEESGETEGRIKSVLEGAGLGVITESLIKGIRAVKFGRKAAEGKATVEEAHAAIADAGEAAQADAKRIAGEEAGRQKAEQINEINRLAEVRLQAAQAQAKQAAGVSATAFPVNTWKTVGVPPPSVPQQVFDDYAKAAQEIEAKRAEDLAKLDAAAEAPEATAENANVVNLDAERAKRPEASLTTNKMLDSVEKAIAAHKADLEELDRLTARTDLEEGQYEDITKALKDAQDYRDDLISRGAVRTSVVPDRPITPVTLATVGRAQVIRIREAARSLPNAAETKAETARATTLKKLLDQYDKVVKDDPEAASKLSARIHATLDEEAKAALRDSERSGEVVDGAIGQTTKEAKERALTGGKKSDTAIDENMARAIMDRYAQSAGAEGAAVKARTTEWDLLNPGVRAKDVNLDHIQTDDNVKTLIMAVSDLSEAQIRTVRGETKGVLKAGVRTDAQRKAVSLAFAKDMGTDEGTLSARLAELTGGTENLDSKLEAARMVHVAAADEAQKATKAYLASKTETDLKRAVVAMQNFAATHTALKGATSEVARGLRSLRDSVSLNKGLAGQLAGINDEGLARQLDPTGSSQSALEAFQKLSGAVSHSTSRRGIGRLFEPGRLRAVEDFYTASILSAPRTHVMNILSNATIAILAPLEKMLGGAVTLDPKMMTRAVDQWRGQLFVAREAFDLAREAWRQNRTFLDNTFGADYQSNFGAEAFGANAKSPFGATLNALGKVVGIVPRALGAQDEFFKQLHYRSELYSSGMAEARASGVADVDEYVRQYVGNGFDGKGMAVRARVPQSQLALASNAYDRALQGARRNTFTEPLDPLLGQGERFLRAVPLGRLVVPFYRTPVSIVKWAARRSLLSGSFYRDALGHNGKEMQQQAYGQAALGTIIYASALSQAIAGNITGAGPSDPNTKRPLQESGWRPYSVKIGDSYVPYNRLDPVGIMLGTTADLYEMQDGTYDDKPDDVIEGALRATVNFAQMLRDKSFMQGIDSVFSAIENGTAAQETANAERFEQRLVGGFVPNVLSSALQGDTVKVPRDAGEALSARLGANLEVKRNFFGEPATRPQPLLASDWISPLQYSNQADADDPLAEIARLSVASRGGMAPTGRRLDGVDLVTFTSPVSQRNAFDRYQELASTVKVGGKTFREAATTLIQSDRYKNHMTDGGEDEEFSARGSRMRAIVALRQRFRNAAERELRKEIPELDKQIKAARAYAIRQRRVSAVGTDASANTVPAGLEWLAK